MSSTALLVRCRRGIYILRKGEFGDLGRTVKALPNEADYILAVGGGIPNPLVLYVHLSTKTLDCWIVCTP